MGGDVTSPDTALSNGLDDSFRFGSFLFQALNLAPLCLQLFSLKRQLRGTHAHACVRVWSRVGGGGGVGGGAVQ